MNQIKATITQLKGTALKITGLTYKIQQTGEVTQDNMLLMNSFTDSISSDVETILKATTSMDVTLKEKQTTMELVKKDNAQCKCKLSMAILQKDEFAAECKKLKLDLDSSQDFLMLWTLMILHHNPRIPVKMPNLPNIRIFQ